MEYSFIDNIIQIFHNSIVNIWIVLIIGYCLEIAVKNKFGIQAYRYQQNIIRYFLSCFFILQISLSCYYILTMLCDWIFLQCGLILIPWLIITGVLINKFYASTISNLKHKAPLENNFEKLFILSSMCILVSFTMIPYNFYLALTSLSIVIGRFFWIDSGINGFTDLYIKSKSFLNTLSENFIHKSIPKKTLILFLSVLLTNFIYYYIHPIITNTFFKSVTSFSISTLLICLPFLFLSRRKY